MAALYHQVWIDAPASRVYEALASAEGLGKWWSPHTSAQTADGLVLSHDPGPEHGVVQQRVLDSTPSKRVEWEVTSHHPGDSPASAWTGTHIVFEISEQKNPGKLRGVASQSPVLSVLDFRHSGWDETSEFFGFCNFAWGATLLKLKDWCESKPGE